MGKLKFGSSKSEFGLRSGTANKGGLPFKQMGSSAVKQGEIDWSNVLGKKENEIKLGNVETRTQDEIKNEQANERIAISKSQAETSAGELALRREKEETRKKELEESKVTKTSMTAEEIKKGKSKAKARDIFTALGSGKAEFSHQQAFDDKIAGFDVKAAEKTENQEELPPAEQFVDDGSYTAVSDAKSSTGEDMFGGIDDAKKVTPGGTEYTVVPQDNMAELTKQAMDWHEQQRKLTGEYKG